MRRPIRHRLCSIVCCNRVDDDTPIRDGDRYCWPLKRVTGDPIKTAGPALGYGGEVDLRRPLSVCVAITTDPVQIHLDRLLAGDYLMRTEKVQIG